MRANERTLRLTVNDKADLCEIPCFKPALVRKLKAALPDDESLEALEVLFGALADRTRLKVLCALKSRQELCVCDLAHVLGMSLSSTSHHLRKLRDLKILKYRNDGKMAYYSLREPFAGKLVSQALTRGLARG